MCSERLVGASVGPLGVVLGTFPICWVRGLLQGLVGLSFDVRQSFPQFHMVFPQTSFVH